MRIAAYDVETAPAQVFTFQLDKPFISLDQVIEPSRVMCFAAQFSDRRKKPVEFYAEWQEGGHEEMVRQAWRIFDEADVLLHFNGKRFDTPWFRTEFVRLGLKPPSPYQEIDLYQATKKFYLMSHKLQHVSTHLVDAGGKVQHSGFSLWKQVLAGDVKAQRTMERYNRGDVKVLWDVFEELKPWLNLPNATLYGAPEGACTRCGSTNVQSRGVQRTALSTFQRYQCQDCSGWFRTNRRLSGATTTQVAS